MITGSGARALVAAQLRAQGEAVQARQLQVEDHDVVAARAQPLEGLPAVAQRLDLEALGPQVVDDQLDDVRVVLDDERSLHGRGKHTACPRPLPRLAPRQRLVAGRRGCALRSLPARASGGLGRRALTLERSDAIRRARTTQSLAPATPSARHAISRQFAGHRPVAGPAPTGHGSGGSGGLPPGPPVCTWTRAGHRTARGIRRAHGRLTSRGADARRCRPLSAEG